MSGTFNVMLQNKRIRNCVHNFEVFRLYKPKLLFVTAYNAIDNYL